MYVARVGTIQLLVAQLKSNYIAKFLNENKLIIFLCWRITMIRTAYQLRRKPQVYQQKVSAKYFSD
jgi:hypothetical protein